LAKALPNEFDRDWISFKTVAAKDSSYIKYKCRLASAGEKEIVVF
jgi:hypothetical protein